MAATIGFAVSGGDGGDATELLSLRRSAEGGSLAEVFALPHRGGRRQRRRGHSGLRACHSACGLRTQSTSLTVASHRIAFSSTARAQFKSGGSG
jgi:hypothetical protein